MFDDMVLPRLSRQYSRPRAAAIATIAKERGLWQRKILGRAFAFVSRQPHRPPVRADVIILSATSMLFVATRRRKNEREHPL
jgi:hypothetical protein